MQKATPDNRARCSRRVLAEHARSRYHEPQIVRGSFRRLAPAAVAKISRQMPRATLGALCWQVTWRSLGGPPDRFRRASFVQIVGAARREARQRASSGGRWRSGACEGSSAGRIGRGRGSPSTCKREGRPAHCRGRGMARCQPELQPRPISSSHGGGRSTWFVPPACHLGWHLTVANGHERAVDRHRLGL